MRLRRVLEVNISIAKWMRGVSLDKDNNSLFFKNASF